jgi:hypothetical protein
MFKIILNGFSAEQRDRSFLFYAAVKEGIA